MNQHYQRSYNVLEERHRLLLVKPLALPFNS